nr:unnamed protein product [Callosobruchus chinensis]
MKSLLTSLGQPLNEEQSNSNVTIPGESSSTSTDVSLDSQLPSTSLTNTVDSDTEIQQNADPMFEPNEGESSAPNDEIILPSKKRRTEPLPGPNNRPDSPDRAVNENADSAIVASRNSHVVWSEVSTLDTLNQFEVTNLEGRRPIDFFLLFFDEEIHNLVVTQTNMPNSRQSRVYVRSQSANTLFCPSGIRSTQMSLCDSLVL